MSKFIKIAQNIGIDNSKKEQVCDFLNDILADQHILYMKMRYYHWTVKSDKFSSYHALFNDQYDQLEAAIDATAERVVMLEGNPLGTLKEMLSKTSLKESKQGLTAKEMIQDLLNDHESCIKSIRKNIDKSEKLNDMGTNDFLIGLIQDHEKMAWFLKATLDK